MTDHPITPPRELVQQWIKECDRTARSMRWHEFEQDIATRAAQWGADQELEATLAEVSFLNSRALADRVRAARRPKPQMLTSIALQMLDTIERDAHYLPEITDTIRRALEALPND
jgi:hypothetical protein